MELNFSDAAHGIIRVFGAAISGALDGGELAGGVAFVAFDDGVVAAFGG